MRIMDDRLCDYHSNALKSVNSSHHYHRHQHTKLHSQTLSTSIAVLIAVLVLVSLPTGCSSQCTEQAGCFPPIGNLAIGRTLETSSTCIVGTEYCIFLGSDCFTCSPNTTNAPANINDNDESTVWVSTIGSPPSPAVLQFDFEAEFLFDNTTIVFNSVRPEAMILERSRDFGATWEVYRYYSTQCTAMFGLEDTFVTDSDEFDTVDPICTSSESLFFPFSEGTVTFSTAQHISPNITRDAATDYQTVTNIRIQLLEVFDELQLNGDRFVYYSISEWYVNGQCKCYGHSASCTPQPGEETIPSKVYSGCDCEHNTAGDQCEMCATGFNNAPWRAGTETTANVCQECVCNEHAEDCEYIRAQSSAMCINCTDNTAGDHCELCQPGYFQDLALLLNDQNICRVCGCSELGAVNDLCSTQGQCSCKSNVDPANIKCTQCLDGYWNLTQSNNDGCQACDCAAEGTVLTSSGLPLCDKETGVCMCTPNAEGRHCDQCRPGYYDLSSGCQPCDCNLGGSESPVCDQDSPIAQCPCKPNIRFVTCSAPNLGYYFKLLDSIVFEAEEASFPQQTSVHFPIEGTTSLFTGRGFIQPAPFSDITFLLTAPQRTQYEIIIRYQTDIPVDSLSMTLYSIAGVGLDLDCDETLTPTNVTRFHVATLLPDQLVYTAFSVCLDITAEYKLLLEYTSFSPVNWLLDSVVLLPAFSEISAYYQARPTQDQVTIIEPCLPRAIPTELDPVCEEPSFSLSTEFFGQVFPCDCDTTGAVNNETCLAFGGQCLCQPGVTGNRCDRCMNGWFGFSTGVCQECNCNSEGSSSPVCDQDSGQCDCHPGTISRTCSDCQSGFFNLTSTGCRACSCSEFALSEQCDESGQCLCPDGVGGLTCDACLPGFYNISSEGCMQCQCDPFGSMSELCDAETGQCSCTGNSVGLNCNECPEGSFLTSGMNRARCVECVCSGKTDECVVDEINYVLGSIESDFTTLCTIEPTECASGWRLLTEDGQQAAPFGPSDSSGLGYILLLNHQPMLFAPDHFIGNRLGSYGQTFDIVVRVGESLDGTGTLLVNATIIRMVGSITGEVMVGVFPYPDIREDQFSASRILSFSIPMLEAYWHVGNREGPTPSQLQFLSVLSDVGQMSVSADFTQDVIEFIHIVNISLISIFSTTELSVTEIVVITRSYPVEDCLCPDEFSGPSCQECARGHARASGDIRDMCVQCNCNNQTLDCNSTTGVCLNCTGNTEGDNCESCTSGYYGDPTRGIRCMPCTCPLSANSFSATCFLDVDDQQTCDSCELGYTGRNCEVCMDGYFGNPLIGFCNDCQCNGNVDPALGPVCDTTTGRCMNCQNNTAGFNCGVCQSGYFGDPTLPDQPCQTCPCDPRGTMGDCDPLFGECFCEPNVMGALCDQCDDGYWGLSQGLGCIPCDCCTNGSVTTTCNKDTGACDCLPNVGSSDDDKCCTCSPGFFNFSSPIGCSACQCSPLAVSSECDLVTGACQCVEGAIGLKCDDCAFGFTGQVPNCERCHDCYFQWYDIIEDLANRISALRVTINSFVTTYYNGHTQDTIQIELDRLTDILNNANRTLSGITLQENNITSLEESLAQVNATLIRYTAGVLDIQSALNTSEMYLDRANAFDGTVNMSDVSELQDLIYEYNSSIGVIVNSANTSFNMLNAIQVGVINIWQELEELELQVKQYTAQLAEAENETARLNQELVNIQSRYNLLRVNLSYFDSRANQLEAEINTLFTFLLNTSAEVQSSNGMVRTFQDNVGERLEQAAVSNILARQLNQTVTTAFEAVLNANLRALQLLDQSEGVVDQANTTLHDILSSLATVDEIYANLTNTSLMALGISDLPEERAVQLAEAIDATILPEGLVEQIVQNASAGLTIAQAALTTAQSALFSVTSTFALVGIVQQNLNCSLEQQEQHTQNLNQLQADANLVENELRQTAELSEALADITSATNQEIGRVQSTSIDNTQQLLEDGQTSLSSLNEQVQSLGEDTSQARQAVDAAVETYRTDLQSQAVNAQNNAANTLNTITSVGQQAQNISTEARRVSLQELQDLLQQYMDESTQLISLRSRVTQLTDKLESLTVSLVNATNNLNSCYETP